jgi:hypothetical protein
MIRGDHHSFGGQEKSDYIAEAAPMPPGMGKYKGLFLRTALFVHPSLLVLTRVPERLTINGK